MTELNIPDDACREFLAAQAKAQREGHGGTSYAYGIAAAAPLIVADAARERAAYYRDLIPTEEDTTVIALHHVRASAFDEWADELVHWTPEHTRR
jgi:hypothetical protein